MFTSVFKSGEYQYPKQTLDNSWEKVLKQMIDVHSIVVSDVVLFEPGEIIPCDGIFLSGHNVPL